MKQNLARDLLLLAAVAYKNQRLDTAGSMFAAAMASDDAPELLAYLDTEGDLDMKGGIADDWGSVQAGDAPRASLASISKSLSDAMSDFSSLAASDDDEDESEDDSSTIEDHIEEDSDDADSDDFNPDLPGQKIIPSSLSSSDQGGGSKARKVTLVMNTKSPVRIKQ